MDAAEKVNIALDKTLELYEISTDGKVKAAALTCNAQCAMALGNLANYIEANGEKYGSGESGAAPQKPPMILIQNNNGVPQQQPDNLPPLAKAQRPEAPAA